MLSLHREHHPHLNPPLKGRTSKQRFQTLPLKERISKQSVQALTFKGRFGWGWCQRTETFIAAEAA
ncbi:MAG: hypothetical protein ABIS07_08290, partial [Dokdonella sp.]